MHCAHYRYECHASEGNTSAQDLEQHWSVGCCQRQRVYIETYLVDRQAKCIHIALPCPRLVEQSLGTHPIQAANVILGGTGIRIGTFSKSEIADSSTGAVEYEDVRALDIAVNNALLMQIGESRGCLRKLYGRIRTFWDTSLLKTDSQTLGDLPRGFV